jgi:hypothetical protein
MAVRVKKIRRIDQEKAELGVSVKFGEAEFIVLPKDISDAYTHERVKQLFLNADADKNIEDAKVKAKNDAIALSKVASDRVNLSRKVDSESYSTLIRDWKINESDCEISARLIAMLVDVYPECISGATGQRTAKYSHKAAIALCSDQKYLFDIEVSDESGAGVKDETKVFREVISILAGKEATDAACNEVPVEKFVPLALK